MFPEHVIILVILLVISFQAY
ncbi:type I toxin-antitoxin system Ibs family toxin [Escherichia coli]|nr:type I toxin-antitoxin system Ibs family toxin [Escherichia coli]